MDEEHPSRELTDRITSALLYACYLSNSCISLRRNPALPTKPCRVTAKLVGKAQAEAGQDGPVHTMVVLQAYQTDLLKDLDHGEGFRNSTEPEI